MLMLANAAELWSRSYSPTNNLFTEQKMPDKLQTTPVIRIHTSIRCSLPVSRPLCSLRWHRHGSMRVMTAPVTLPVKPISSENLGTSRARKYDVISRAARTSRAGREIPEPSASVGEAERWHLTVRPEVRIWWERTNDWNQVRKVTRRCKGHKQINKVKVQDLGMYIHLWADSFGVFQQQSRTAEGRTAGLSPAGTHWQEVGGQRAGSL